MMAKYRVVTDDFIGFEAQVKYWYWPFWFELHGINTWQSLSDAIKFIELVKSERAFKCKIVKTNI